MASPGEQSPAPADHAVNAAAAPVRSARALSWILLALTLAGVLATLTLGSWQLRRAAFKEALTRQIAEQNQLPALQNIAVAAIKNIAENDKSNAAAPGQSSPLHRSVELRGTWLHDYTVFLDNRFMAGKPGFYVVTPLLLQGQSAAVWVQRGWVARDAQERTRLPQLPASQDEVLVTGRLVEGISRVYALGEPENTQLGTATGQASADVGSAGTPSSAPGWARASRIWQNLPALKLEAPLLVLPVAVLQTPAAFANDGLLRDWPQADAGVAKHYGYAFQWFALCGLIIALYVWFQILAPRRKQPRGHR